MDKQYYKEYYHLERSNWWFQARLRILEHLIRKKIPKDASRELRILNAGVATGATTKMLEKFGQVVSLEYDKECCEFLRNDLDMEVVNGSLTELPFDSNSFDLVCAFDVIEHIEDDHTAVNEIYRVLKPEGIMFLTVPAFKFLWSNHDVVNHHFRRYTIGSLRKVVSENSFKTDYISYFNFFLFLPILSARMVLNMRPKTQKNDTSGSDFDVMKPSDLLNRFLFKIFLAEKWLLGKRIKLPFGVSAMVMSRK